MPNLAVNSFPRGVAVHPNPLRPLVYVANRTVNSFSDDGTNPYVDQCDSLVARPPVNVNPDQCVGSLSIFDLDLKRQVGSVAVGWAPEGVAVINSDDAYAGLWREMAALGWRVRRVRGVLTALCPDCVRSHDEAGEE